MSPAQTPQKRPLRFKELRLGYFADDYRKSGLPKDGALLHARRIMIGRQQISEAACGRKGLTRYNMPLLPWMLESAPICPECRRRVLMEVVE